MALVWLAVVKLMRKVEAVEVAVAVAAVAVVVAAAGVVLLSLKKKNNMIVVLYGSKIHITLHIDGESESNV